MENIKYWHYISMGIIILGSLVLFSLALLWYLQGNFLMGLGMLIMGLIAASNFYLHLMNMKNKQW